MSVTETLDVRVESITAAAQGIKSFELVPLSRRELPVFTAGAHIDLHLRNELVRSYSLVNPQGERHRYVVAVNRDPASKGGSAFLHDELAIGDKLNISIPRNNFPLAEDEKQFVFFAGGIGVTPIWCMIQRLEVLGRDWRLFYSARTRNNAAFLDDLELLEGQSGGRVHLNFDQEPGGKMLDLNKLISAIPKDVHLYCCGPKPMLAAFETACAARPQTHVHVEYFTAKMKAATDGGFTVILARSGRSFRVDAGKTILETLTGNNIDLPFSCMQGVCGTCETKVIDGVPDHRDVLMTEAEHDLNKTIMICCSGSKSQTLVLDL
jgi:ferredoxin-NADP reductase